MNLSCCQHSEVLLPGLCFWVTGMYIKWVITPQRHTLPQWLKSVPGSLWRPVFTTHPKLLLAKRSTNLNKFMAQFKSYWPNLTLKKKSLHVKIEKYESFCNNFQISTVSGSLQYFSSTYCCENY